MVGQMTGVRKYDVTAELYRRHLKHIPEEQVYPIASQFVTTLSNKPLANECYIKRPKLFHLDDVDLSRLIPKTFANEMEILELLKDFHHPNHIHYRGCTMRNGRLTGIALERHEATLLYRYEDDERPFDIIKCMRDLRAGIDQLHRLGLAHNDLNPSNILLAKDDRSIIIDFDSCKRFGSAVEAFIKFWNELNRHQSNFKTSHPKPLEPLTKSFQIPY